MKVAYKHLLNFIPSKPSIDEISECFFQLGHEHEIVKDVFEMELTPNRGDCLSINGLIRDLALFYEVEPTNNELYDKKIKKFDINFNNEAKDSCSHISFLKIDIEDKILPYHGKLKSFFDDLDHNKNNFFTDVSNYILYEFGQPTHCYDSKKIGNKITLERNSDRKNFETLLDQEIRLDANELVFVSDKEVINLAGIVGGKNTSCSENTKSVIVECAYFNPEEIIGKSIKFDIKSDAAYRFERGVDPLCHKDALRRFLKIVDEHATIKNVELYSESFSDFEHIRIPFIPKNINKILGTSKDTIELENYLLKLGFAINEKIIVVPSYRSDIQTENDIAEEIARAIGYDNLPSDICNIPETLSLQDETFDSEEIIKNLLLKHGFFEVINNPFVAFNKDNSIHIDNPLDSNKNFLRTNLKTSLVENLLYNQRRQKDSIKLFEISDTHTLNNENNIISKRSMGIICSGRVGKNYKDFSKKIDIKYLKDILNPIFSGNDISPIKISKEDIDSKLNNEIIYIEIKLDNLALKNIFIENKRSKKILENKFKKYQSISEYPSSLRDLSFSVKEVEKYYELQEVMLNYENDLIKEIYIFDYFLNKKNDEIKIGFRFIFQSKISTITEKEVNRIMNNIIDSALSIESVEIPGIKK